MRKHVKHARFDTPLAWHRIAVYQPCKTCSGCAAPVIKCKLNVAQLPTKDVKEVRRTESCRTKVPVWPLRHALAVPPMHPHKTSQNKSFADTVGFIYC